MRLIPQNRKWLRCHSIAVLFLAASSLAAERRGPFLHADVLGRANPAGVAASLGAAYRRNLKDGAGPAASGRYLQGGAGLTLSPAFAQASAHAEAVPRAFLQLRFQMDQFSYLGTNAGLLSFPSSSSPFGDRERDALAGQEESRSGRRLLLQPTLRYQAGRLLLRNQTDLARYWFSGRGPFFLELEYDTLLKRQDDLLSNRTQFLWEFLNTPAAGRRLLAGPYYEGTWAAGSRLARHRVGLACLGVLTTRFRRLDRPRVFLQVGVNAADPNRRGPFFAGGLGADFDLPGR